MEQKELFELPELDKQKTKEAVEEAFVKYRMYKYLQFDDREAAITSPFKDVVVKTSGTSDKTADTAIYNADMKEYQKRFCEKLERVVKHLPTLEQFLVEKRYMDRNAEYMTDLKMYNFVFQPPISAKFYYKLQRNAFYKIALAMNFNVEKNK